MTTCPHCDTPCDAKAVFCPSCKKVIDADRGFDGLETIRPGELSEIGKAFTGTSGLLEPGTIIGRRYTIEALLASSATGHVYRAIEKLGQRNREVALKVFTIAEGAAEGLADRFLEQSMVNQQIRHPGVVAIRNVGKVDNGQPFVAMELIEGASLREWFSTQVKTSGEVAFEACAAIVSALADALSAGHKINIIHGNLRPERVILCGENGADPAALKLLGFGVAGREVLNTSGTSAAWYDPPEAARGQLLPASDIYSLCVIFYELLMGVLPVAPVQAPASARTDVPAAIDKLIMEGLSPDANSRPADAEQFAIRLRNAIADADGGVQPVPLDDVEAEDRSEGEVDANGRITIKRGALFVRPHRDANGNWYMPDMIDANGKRTKWSKLWGYSKAWLK